MDTLVEVWSRSFMMPSIQAVADMASSIEAEPRVAGAVLEVGMRPGGGAAAAFDRILFLSISAGGNKGRPEKPQTAGRWDWVRVRVSLQLVIKSVESVGDKNQETDGEADPPDLISAKFVGEGGSVEVVTE